MNTRSKTKKSQKLGNNIETYTFKNKVHPMITRYKLLKEYSINESKNKQTITQKNDNNIIDYLNDINNLENNEYVLEIGTRIEVSFNYIFKNKPLTKIFYPGVIERIQVGLSGLPIYHIKYDDGDYQKCHLNKKTWRLEKHPHIINNPILF